MAVRRPLGTAGNLPELQQLPVWAEVPEDAPVASPVLFKTVVTAPAQRPPKRTELPQHLPPDLVILPLSPEERAGADGGSERPVIGYETSERLDAVPASLTTVRLTKKAKYFKA